MIAHYRGAKVLEQSAAIEMQKVHMRRHLSRLAVCQRPIPTP